MKLTRITRIVLASALLFATVVVGCGTAADSPQSPEMPQVPQMPGQPQTPIGTGAPGSPTPPSVPSSSPPFVPPVPAPQGPPVDIPADLTLSPAGREALQMIMRTAFFGGWAMGAAGSPSGPVSAFRTLLTEPNAVAAFAFAVSHGTLAGQLTALSGLYLKDQARFRSELPRFRGREEIVELQTAGCDPTGERVPAGTIAEAPNSVQLSRPEESLTEWSTRNPGRPIVFDIAGGGYPAVLRGAR